MPKVDWDAVEEQDFSPVPEGKYEVVIDEVKTTNKDDEPLTSKDGDEMWRVRFSIVGPKYANRKIFTHLVFSEGGLGNVKKLFSAIFGTKLPKKPEPSDILDERLAIDVTIGEYKGKQNNSIPYAGYYAAEEEDEDFN